MAKHSFIVPKKVENPFPVSFTTDESKKIKDFNSEFIRPGTWEPGYPFYDKRDYYIVYEVAQILIKKRIIRRQGVDGIQQTRKYIKNKEFFPRADMYLGSRKYGYLIKKAEFAEFYSEMTGGDDFLEYTFANECLLSPMNYQFITFKIKEFRSKAEKCRKKLLDPKLSDKDRLKLQYDIAAYEQKAKSYQMEWQRLVFKLPEERS